MIERVYKGVRRATLIGGGDLMAETAEMLIRDGYPVAALLAPRHADEALPITGGQLRTRLQDAGAAVTLVEDINDLSAWPIAHCAGADVVALCFGPAWIFSPAVVAAFGFGMINVNMIPIPRYLGGAHYTWQILNGDRDGGCFLQEVSAKVDRGDILCCERFELPPSARVPADYFLANFECGRRCLENFLRAMRDGTPLRPTPFDGIAAGRLYFPRVLTTEQAYIDWHWSAEEIVRFCNAFDRPYAGAATFFEGTLVRLKNVELVNDAGDLHPFAAGLVVRRTANEIVIAARGGALRPGIVQDEAGFDTLPRLREGRRLSTPAATLERALTFRPQLSAKGFDAPGKSR